MAEGKDGKNGKEAQTQASPEPKAQPIEAQVLGQFIKDLSFESPSVSRLLEGPAENPSLALHVNVEASRLRPDIFESGIDFKAHATSKDATIYDLELKYAGLFRLKSIPEPALEPILLINCPTLIFPFLRRIVSDITRDGGFPPLLLDPIDFAALYARRQKERAGAAGGQPS